MVLLAFLQCFVLLLISAPVWAQILPFQYYTRDDRLLIDAVTCLYQDSQGYILIGSAEGLTRFDGYSFVHYRTKDGLPSNFINCIYEQASSPGTIWLGTNNGIAKFNGNRLSAMLLDTTERSRLVVSIWEDATKRLWCGTLGGLYMVWRDSVTKVNLPVDYVNQIEVLGPEEDSLVWVAVNNHLLEFSLSGDLVRGINLSSSNLNATASAFRDRLGNIWIGLADSTLSLFRNGVLVHKRPIAEGQVLHIMDDPQQNLHLGTENGLLSINIDQFAVGKFERIRPESGLPSKRIIGGLVDREGSFWLACNNAGIVKLITPDSRENSITSPFSVYDRP